MPEFQINIVIQFFITFKYHNQSYNLKGGNAFLFIDHIYISNSEKDMWFTCSVAIYR